MKVLFVCRQNICRSQIATAYFNTLTQDSSAASAGTVVELEGQTIKDYGASNTIKVMLEDSIDVSDASSRQLKPEMLDGVDVVISMAQIETVPDWLRNDRRYQFWDVFDPKTSSEDKVREVRNDVKSKVLQFMRANKLPKKVPDVIKKYGLDFSWDAEDVWKLDVPVETIPISELTWHFDFPYWSRPGGFFDLAAKEVLADPKKYTDEYTRIQKADTSYPIDIMWRNDRWVILDGLHRLVKLSEQGAKEIQVRKIPRSMIPLIAKKTT